MKKQTTSQGISIQCRFDKLVDASKLKPNPRNPYRHPEEQIARLAHVIKENGWRNPVVVSKRSGLIVKGHGRQLAGLLLVDNVPVEFQDYASEQKENDDLLADNRIPELAERDDSLLAELLKGIDEKSMLAAGYMPSEVEELLKKLAGTPPSQFPMVDENIAIQHQCPKCGYKWSGKPG